VTISPSEPTSSRDLWVRWGQRLTAERKRQHWTQMQLAAYSGVSQATISAIERGVAGGSDLARYELEKALDAPGLFALHVPDEEAS
jgi:transcriptional regulator with XRE-family HTH domain